MPRHGSSVTSVSAQPLLDHASSGPDGHLAPSAATDAEIGDDGAIATRRSLRQRRRGGRNAGFSVRPRGDASPVGPWTALAMTVFLQSVTMLLLFLGGLGGVPEVAGLVVRVVAILPQLVQVTIVTGVTWFVARHSDRVQLWQAWVYYAMMVLAFAGVYAVTAAMVGRDVAFGYSSGVKKSVDGVLWPYYYSMSTMTLVGFGDIFPSHALTKFVTLLQCFLGVLYHVFIISNTLTGVQRAQKPSGLIKKLTFRRRVSRIPLLKRLRKFGRRYMLPISLVVQAGNFIVLFAAEKDLFQVKDVGLELLLPSLGIQLLHLSFVFATSLKLARKTYKVTPDFLPNERPFTIRCENVENNGCPTGESDPQFWTVVYKFLYMSLGIMTSAGYGDIAPTTWYARIAVALEMFVSVFYSTVIMGLGLRMLSRYGEGEGPLIAHEASHRESLAEDLAALDEPFLADDTDDTDEEVSGQDSDSGGYEEAKVDATL